MAEEVDPVKYEFFDDCFTEYGLLKYKKDYFPLSIDNGRGVYVDKDNFNLIFGLRGGQIDQFSQFGEWIHKIAKDPSGPSQWLDVGTWNGNGSTRCILDGFAWGGKHKHCITIETHPFLFNVAQTNLKNHNAFNQITFLNTKLSCEGAENFIPPPIKDGSDWHCIVNYETEIELWKLTPSATLFYEPDAVILDGGEYTGYIDWLSIPKNNLSYVFLDDVNSTKNKKVRQELLENPEWQLLHENLSDRNGWSIFIKLN